MLNSSNTEIKWLRLMRGINTQHSYKQHVVKDKKSSSKELKKSYYILGRVNIILKREVREKFYSLKDFFTTVLLTDNNGNT